MREVARERQREQIVRLRGRSTSRSARHFSSGGARNSGRRRPDRSCSRDPSAPATISGPAPSSTGRMLREPAAARSTCFAHVDAASSSAYTSHLMDPDAGGRLLRRVLAPRAARLRVRVEDDDFPWMGIWEENHSRTQPPWNGETFTRGMEFGVSPLPESRRAMIDRGRLFGVPTYRWIPARTKVAVQYWIHCHPATCRAGTACAPELADWPLRDARGRGTVEWRARRHDSARSARQMLPERALCFYFEIEDLRHDTILSRSTPDLEPARRDDAGSRTAASRAEGAEGAARHVQPPRPPAAHGRSH